MSEYFRIKNWMKHQHYKDRRPPWIKLHNSLFDDYEFQCLQDASKLHLIAIWLLASRSTRFHEDGDPLLPVDISYLQRQTGLKGKIDLNPLISSGFLICYQDASKLLANCYTETETYKSNKRQKREERISPSENAVKIYDYYSKEVRKHSTSKARALKNIDRLLGTGNSPEVLWECINAYSTEISRNRTEEQYRKTCANFFGIDDPAYIGFIEDAKRRVEKYDKEKV